MSVAEKEQNLADERGWKKDDLKVVMTVVYSAVYLVGKMADSKVDEKVENWVDLTVAQLVSMRVEYWVGQSDAHLAETLAYS